MERGHISSPKITRDQSNCEVNLSYKMMDYEKQEADIRHLQQTSHGAFVGNFKMSQKECENFLLEITKELNFQKKQLGSHAEVAYKEIT